MCNRWLPSGLAACGPKCEVSCGLAAHSLVTEPGDLACRAMAWCLWSQMQVLGLSSAGWYTERSLLSTDQQSSGPAPALLVPHVSMLSSLAAWCPQTCMRVFAIFLLHLNQSQSDTSK